LMISDLAAEAATRGERVVVYTNRRSLVDQTSRYLAGQGIPVGVRAAEYEHDPDKLVQISSVQTEDARVLRSAKWGVHDAKLVVMDEAHSLVASVAQALMACHVEGGGMVVGFTATPLGLGGLYDELFTAATNSELRACGALVPALHYGCDEPHPQSVKYRMTDEVSEGMARKAVMRHGVFGRVLDWYRRLNPEGKPTILFAPGVPESVYFCEEFERNGVPSAHIDGESTLIAGRWYKSDKAAREAVLDGSRDGGIRVVCNRFVLREGVDAPWLGHGIFATVFGTVQSYLQAGGRLLRAYPGMSGVRIQDHGGNWWRHGSLNADRIWGLGDTAQRVSAAAEDGYRDRGEPQPWVCPQCQAVNQKSRACFHCKHEPSKLWKRSRPVVQTDGSLVPLGGDPHHRRVAREKPDTQEKWKRMYYRMRRTAMTFRQARGLFFQEEGYWPPTDIPLTPVFDHDWYTPVADVGYEHLRRGSDGTS
jgi:superfamily II DNA or RNA helicase